MATKHLTEKERYYIEFALGQNMRVIDIAQNLGRSKVCIYNEIKRGTVKQRDTHYVDRNVYCADVGKRVHEERGTLRGAPLKIGKDLKLALFIENMIKDYKYSPKAVLNYIKSSGMKFDTDLSEWTIYLYIRKGVLNLKYQDLPSGKKCPTKLVEESTVALNNKLARTIEDRPKEVLNREEFGHWEMDTVVGGHGKGKSKECLLVLSERMTRFEIIRKIESKSKECVVKELDKIQSSCARTFDKIFKTITCDNGCEFLDSKGIMKNNRTELYYCHPYTSCERGTNENINKMIRRWIPKGCDIGTFTHEKIKEVQDWINEYPRDLFEGFSSKQFMEMNNIKVF